MTINSAKKVLVAVSGGIDSAVTAALLKSQGFDVTAVHFQMSAPVPSGTQPTSTQLLRFPREGGSCALASNDEHGESRAKAICKQLGIQLHIVNLSEQYQARVVDYVIHDSLRMRYPNPCTICHTGVKIPALLDKASELKCDTVATGHYAKVVKSSDGNETNLYRALDKKYDQSHFLVYLNQEQLGKLITPVGELLRSNIERMADTFRLPCERRPLQSKLCFSDSEHYKELVTDQTTDRYRPPGPVVTQEGNVLNRHAGLYRHRLGEQAPLLAADKIEYRDYKVVGYDPRISALIVGPEKDLFRNSFMVTSCNWVGMQDFSKGLKATAKIGLSPAEYDCSITLLAGESVWIEFKDELRGLLMGQPIVFYHDDLVLGGGWLETSTKPVTTKLKPR